MVISRFAYMKGVKCGKLLWTLYNDPGSLPPHYDGTQGVFYDGAAASDLAHSLFPDIIFAERGGDNDAIAAGKPIFRACVGDDEASATIDILKPLGEGEWEILQFSFNGESPGSCPPALKGLMQCKQIKHVRDIAFQMYCCGKSGVRVGKCQLLYVNSDYVRMGALDSGKLLTCEDVTAKVLAEYDKVEPRVMGMRRTIELEECPPFAMFENQTDCLGNSHLDLRHCPMVKKCREAAGEVGGGGETGTADSGMEANFDIPAAREFLERLVFPVAFLDIQYFCRPVPLEGCRPYTLLPFVFSLHSLDAIDSGRIISHSWIWDGKGDPRVSALHKLSELIGKHGSIVDQFGELSLSPLAEFASESPGHQHVMQELNSRLIQMVCPLTQEQQKRLYFNIDECYKTMFPEVNMPDDWLDSMEFIHCSFNQRDPAARKATSLKIKENSRTRSMIMLRTSQKIAGLCGKEYR
ncbi:MAG: hypothetical protein JW808_05125 [Victivallales bacterium]|nr:hypothetical protein [Victivallales bacterium]